MIVGIGTDILSMERLRKAVAGVSCKEANSFIYNVFTETEIQLAYKRRDPTLFFATRFAGKEAVLKALAPDCEPISMRQIEIRSKQNGQPEVFLYGDAERVRQEKRINRVLISLSYDTDFALAYVICESDAL